MRGSALGGRRPRSCLPAVLGLLASVVLGLGGCRSLRVELVAGSPTQVSGPAASSAGTETPPVVGRAPNTPTPRQPSGPVATPPAAPATVPVAVLTPAPSPAPDPGTSYAPRGATQSVTGTISAAGQKDRYQFAGQQGQLLEARVRRTSGISLQPSQDLLDPTGLAEANAFGVGEESVLTRKLASSGTYTLVVGGPGQGPYVATWSLDRFGHLVSDEEVSAEITERSQQDRYRFEARQGQILDASVKRTSGIGLQPSLDVIDPMSLHEASGSFGMTGESHLEQKLASSGTYLLVVSGSGQGPYTIRLTLR